MFDDHTQNYINGDISENDIGKGKIIKENGQMMGDSVVVLNNDTFEHLVTEIYWQYVIHK